MNLVGHIAVARLLDDQATYWLGAALPDLATIARVRLLGQCADEAVTAGIRAHHRTDDEFHSSEWFRSRQARLLKVLTDAGVPRGPARAAAHVGPELLIDGALLMDGDAAARVNQAFATISELGPTLGPLAPGQQKHWLAQLRSIANHGLPTDYHDPLAVAQRLQRILARRPRLALDASHVPTVAAALEAENFEPGNGIRASSNQLVADIAKGVAQRLSLD